jgi:hypothetical protein
VEVEMPPAHDTFKRAEKEAVEKHVQENLF